MYVYELGMNVRTYVHAYMYVCVLCIFPHMCAYIVFVHIHVIVVPLFWSVHGECTEGISVN